MPLRSDALRTSPSGVDVFATGKSGMGPYTRPTPEGKHAPADTRSVTKSRHARSGAGDGGDGLRLLHTHPIVAL